MSDTATTALNTNNASNMVGATFLCSTCSASFESNASRREHMREPWHVFNMQRKVAELQPISLLSYQSLVGTPNLEKRIDRSVEPEASKSILKHTNPCSDEQASVPTATSTQDSDSSDEDDVLLAQPERCLFCTSTSETIDDCLDHMQQSHGFHIPRIEALETDIETFLAYLNLVISRFHSCLYCGHEKYSADAVRSHMISKGHCMLDLSEDSDFLDFWTRETDVEGKLTHKLGISTEISDAEMRLPSGSVASSRNDGRPATRPSRSKRQPSESTALVTTSPDHDRQSSSPTPTQQPSSSSRPSTSLVLSQRDQQSLIGLSDAQHRSLALTHKKLIAREQRFKNDARWTVEKFGNKTKMKHFKPDVPGRKNG